MAEIVTIEEDRRTRNEPLGVLGSLFSNPVIEEARFRSVSDREQLLVSLPGGQPDGLPDSGTARGVGRRRRAFPGRAQAACASRRAPPPSQRGHRRTLGGGLTRARSRRTAGQRLATSHPDGKEVAFVVPTTSNFEAYSIGIARADAQGSRRTLVEANGSIWLPTMSPDGTRIAYQDGGSIYVVDVSTGESSRWWMGTLLSGSTTTRSS
jgi:hypothetical protein